MEGEVAYEPGTEYPPNGYSRMDGSATVSMRKQGELQWWK